MSEFSAYFQLGYYHILDLAAFDHMLFLVALCAVFQPREWREVLILVTAFTVGHSLTLALATRGAIQVNSELIEFLIPLTILVTALQNVFLHAEERSSTMRRLNYILVLFFGLIHGMGFSNYLRALLGEEESILWPLFAFNVGIEAGQIIIVAIIMLLGYLAVGKLNFKHREWNIFLSGAAAGVALKLMHDTWIW